jgi:hypothetical protein
MPVLHHDKLSIRQDVRPSKKSQAQLKSDLTMTRQQQKGA